MFACVLLATVTQFCLLAIDPIFVFVGRNVETIFDTALLAALGGRFTTEIQGVRHW